MHENGPRVGFGLTGSLGKLSMLRLQFRGLALNLLLILSSFYWQNQQCGLLSERIKLLSFVNGSAGASA